MAKANSHSLAPDIFKTAARGHYEAFESKGVSKYVRKACKKVRKRAKRSEDRFINICTRQALAEAAEEN